MGPGCSLPPGRYGYDPLCHRVHRLAGVPRGARPGVTVELSVTPQRTVSHYGHRAWPLLLLDTGHAAAALWLAARALPLPLPPPVLGLDGAAAHPLAALHFVAAGAAQRGADAPTPPELLARRSARPPLRGAPPAAVLRTLLATVTGASAGEIAWCAALGPPHPGIVELTSGGTLRRLAAGEARPTLAAWAAGQGWIADTGAVLLGYGCPADATDARIRRTHLRAGFAAGLAQVTAARHGVAGRPLGSWQQADLGAALGRAPGREWVVHGLALGTTHPEEGTL
ncbi:nitroreductase family protein [Streptomyces xiamenensis]